MSPLEFAEQHGLRFLAEDQVALNAEHVFFWVETFEPTEKFRPQKPYQSRLKWRTPDGSEHSRLLLMEPAIVAAMAANQSDDDETSSKKSPKRPAKGRRKLKELGAARTQ